MQPRNDYLSHHGIKGQRWGVRRFQYKNGQLTVAGQARYRGGGLTGIDIPVSEVKSSHNTVAGLLKKSSATVVIHDGSELPRKPGPTSVEDDVLNTNPHFKGFGKTERGYLKNCMYCTATYDLRRRGYDISANKRDAGGPPTDVLKWYKDPKLMKPGIPEGMNISVATATKVLLERQPEGSRGNLMGFNNRYGAGHSVAYEIRDGKIDLLDCQTQAKLSWDYFAKNFGDSMYYCRTDNLEPKWEGISEVIHPESFQPKKEEQKMKHNDIDTSESLSHHGIMGQKWGVRRFQNKDGTRTAAGKKRYSDSSSTKTSKKGGESEKKKHSLNAVALANQNQQIINQNQQIINQNQRFMDDYINQHQSMTDLFNQQNAINQQHFYSPSPFFFGVSVPTKKTWHRDLGRDVEVDILDITDDSMIPRKPKRTTSSADRSAVNPQGRRGNALNCATVYDLRRRGYDVTAHGTGWSDNYRQIKRYYKDPEFKTYSNHGEVIRHLQSQPTKSRGILYGGDHPVSYEVDKAGHVTLEDAMTNQRRSFTEYFKGHPAQSAMSVRTDNLEPRWDDKLSQVIDPASVNGRRDDK